MEKYKHISFKREWTINTDCAYMLGECNAYVNSLSNIPLKPEDRAKLHQVSLIKGAQATTAIEGNTLSEKDIKKLLEGLKLPPSKEYLEIEVKNILEAFNKLLSEIVDENKDRLITPNLIKEFHYMIGKNLGKHFDAKPGQFRSDNRVVGPYLAPNYNYVPDLIEKLCAWLKKDFRFPDGQSFSTSIIQAIVTHVYIEWIHPFGDGNGRTGRLLEFYILLRAGLPSIASHVLSNFYNQTRTEYYRQLNDAREKRDLTEFFNYAIRGLRDGLKENLALIQESQFTIFWQYYIYNKFAEIKYTRKDAFKRKRELILEFPINKELTIDEITLLTPKIAQKYAKVNKITITRDLKELQELKLLIKKGKKYKANTETLTTMMPRKKLKKE